MRHLIAVLALSILLVQSFALLTALPAAAQVGTRYDEDDIPDDAQEAYFVDIVDGDTFTLDNGTNIYTFSYQYDGGVNANDFGLRIENIQPVPEPTAAAMVMGAFGCLAWRLRSRRRSA